jgi:hypothetical protein
VAYKAAGSGTVASSAKAIAAGATSNWEALKQGKLNSSISTSTATKNSTAVISGVNSSSSNKHISSSKLMSNANSNSNRKNAANSTAHANKQHKSKDSGRAHVAQARSKHKK